MSQYSQLKLSMENKLKFGYLVSLKEVPKKEEQSSSKTGQKRHLHKLFQKMSNKEQMFTLTFGGDTTDSSITIIIEQLTKQ